MTSSTQHRTASGRLLGNTLWLAASSGAARILAYVQFLLAIKAFTEEEVGIYAVLLTAVLFSEMLSNLGLDRVLVRETVNESLHGRGSLLRTAIRLKARMATATYVVSLCALYALYPEIFQKYRLAISLFMLYVPICAYGRCLESYFMAEERMDIPALAQIAERTILLSAAVLAWMEWIPFDGFLCALPVAGATRAGLSRLALPRKALPSLEKVTRQTMRHLTAQSAWMFGVEIMALAYFRIDIFMISTYLDFRSAAFYQAAYKIFDFCIGIFTGYLLALFPTIARDTAQLKPRGLLLGAILTFVAFSLPVIALRDPILAFFKPEYVQASQALHILMLTLPFVFINALFANYAIAAAKTRELFLLAVPMLVVNVSLNAIYIPRYGIAGAAGTTLVGEIVLTFLFLVTMRPFSNGVAPMPRTAQENL